MILVFTHKVSHALQYVLEEIFSKHFHVKFEITNNQEHYQSATNTLKIKYTPLNDSELEGLWIPNSEFLNRNLNEINDVNLFSKIDWIPMKKVEIMDSTFIKMLNLLNLQNENFKLHEHYSLRPVYFPMKSELGFDIFSHVFVLLSNIEEIILSKDSENLDKFNRIQSNKLSFVKTQMHLLPMVEIAIERLKDFLKLEKQFSLIEQTNKYLEGEKTKIINGETISSDANKISKNVQDVIGEIMVFDPTNSDKTALNKIIKQIQDVITQLTELIEKLSKPNISTDPRVQGVITAPLLPDLTRALEIWTEKLDVYNNLLPNLGVGAANPATKVALKPAAGNLVLDPAALNAGKLALKPAGPALKPAGKLVLSPAALNAGKLALKPVSPGSTATTPASASLLKKSATTPAAATTLSPLNQYLTNLLSYLQDGTNETSVFQQFKSEFPSTISDLSIPAPSAVKNILNAIIASVSTENKDLLTDTNIDSVDKNEVLLIINKNIIILFSMYLIIISKLTVKDPFLVLNMYNGFRASYDKLYDLIAAENSGAAGVGPVETSADEILKNENTVAFIKSILLAIAFSVTAGGISASASGMLLGPSGGKKYTKRRNVVKRQYKTKRQRKLNLKGKKYVTRKMLRKKYKGKQKSKI